MLRGASGAFAVLRVPPCARGLWAVCGSKRVLQTSFGLERSLGSTPFFPSRGTFESPPKCDCMIDVNTRLSPRKQKGWRRRHPFLAERLLMRTLLGKTNLRCRGKLRLCVFLLSLAVLSCLALGLQVSRYTHSSSKQALTSLRVASLFGELRPAFLCVFCLLILVRLSALSSPDKTATPRARSEFLRLWRALNSSDSGAL